MVEFGTREPRPSGNGGHTMSPTDIRKRREARRQRSTKGMAAEDRTVPASGPVKVSARRLSISADRVSSFRSPGRLGSALTHYWLPPRRH